LLQPWEVTVTAGQPQLILTSFSGTRHTVPWPQTVAMRRAGHGPAPRDDGRDDPDLHSCLVQGAGRIAAISWLIKLSTAGASFADWTGKDRNAGGLGWGDGPVAAVLAVLVVAGVASLTVSGSDRAKEVELGPLLAGES
jgi:hypothetical protein